MKTFLKFCLASICLSLSANLFSQNFISENKVWSIVSEGGMEQPWTRTISYKFSGDSTVQQTHYKKLYSSEDEQKKDWELNSLWFERNDSIFKYWPWTSETILVYDFNIAEKDSFRIDEFLTIYVDSVRVKEWGGKLRKHWYFVGGENNSSKTTVWVEGVGNINNFTRSTDINITGAFTSLLCFTENDELVYQNPKYNSCSVNTSVPIIENKPEFAPIGAEWYYSQYVGFDPPQGANYVKHTCFKDSTINGKLVKVIQKTKFTREGPVELGYEYLHQNGDTISYWKNGEFHELYNFSLLKGDSMLIYADTVNYFICDTSQYGWINIDTVFTETINNQALKCYFATSKEGSFWGFGSRPILEKIGSTDYLLPRDEGCTVDRPGIGPLRCYSDPVFGIFYNGKEPCDTLTTFPVYSPTINRNDLFKLYPNPANNKITIFNPFNIKINKIELFDFSGRVVQMWVEPELAGNQLNIQHILPGIYLLKAETDAGVKTEKLVVQ